MQTKWSNCRLSIYGAIGSLVVPAPTMIFGKDIGTFLVTVAVAFIVALILLVVFVRTIKHQVLSALSMLAIFALFLGSYFRSPMTFARKAVGYLSRKPIRLQF
jgi:hypothetical protein